MKTIKLARQRKRISQRNLAERAAISFKGLQLIEQQDHDIKVSTLRKIANALGLPGWGIDFYLSGFMIMDPDSIEATSLRILEEGADAWPIHLMNFVDAFQRNQDQTMIHAAPVAALDQRIRCLMTSTVEHLCMESNTKRPSWTAGIGRLENPWFVSGMENLKAMALMESPAAFRKRNIFVLADFLQRV
jgi:transcriptional regulator with XRE-family HTH domain